MAKLTSATHKLNSLREFLLAEPDRYNTLFALARRARPRLEQERFVSNLEEYLVPLVEVAEPESREKLVGTLYELLLELTGLELFARSEAVRALWLELLPNCHVLVSQAPGSVVPRLTNACYNLEREAGADWRFWLERMKHFATQAQGPEQWLSIGQVLAWVSGLAHYRESASELAAKLPSELAAQLVPRWDRVQDDAWWSRRPAPGQLAKVHELGGFIGFGGVFRRPPELIAAGENQFLVSDGTEEWLLCCDGFGATLKRVFDFEMVKVPKNSFKVSGDGTISWKGKEYDYPELGPVSTFDVSGSVLAVTSERSHRLHVFLGAE